jgi:hypothetical protein
MAIQVFQFLIRLKNQNKMFRLKEIFGGTLSPVHLLLSPGGTPLYSLHPFLRIISQLPLKTKNFTGQSGLNKNLPESRLLKRCGNRAGDFII